MQLSFLKGFPEIPTYHVDIAEACGTELQQALDATKDRLTFPPSSDLYTALTKPLQTLCLLFYENAGLVWKDRVLFSVSMVACLKPGFDKANASPGDTERENEKNE